MLLLRIFPLACLLLGAHTTIAEESLRGSAERFNVTALDFKELARSNGALAAIFEKKLDSVFGEGIREHGIDRKLVEAKSTCNTVVASYSALEFRTVVNTIFEESDDLGGQSDIFLNGLVQTFRTGMQIWKVCGKCDPENPGKDACREEDYAFGAMHSGLAILPYDKDADMILPGTHKFNVVAPAAGSTPSKFATYGFADTIVLVGAMITASSGSITIFTDYLGFGESTDYEQAFCVSQSIKTATYPLLTATEKILEDETDCTAAMADDCTVFGYSEGGYGAIAIADMLDKMGKKLLAVHAGGGPYKVSTFMLDYAIRIVPATGLDFSGRFTGLFGAAYSSTTEDVVNYGQGQDFLNSEYRDVIVDAVNERSRRKVRDAMPENTLDAVNQDLVSIVMKHEDKACTDKAKKGKTDLLCQALVDNDLVDVIEKAKYPLYLCHSEDDTFIPYENLPDPKKLGDNVEIITVNGDHGGQAALECILNNVLLYYIDQGTGVETPIMEKTKPTCTATAAPSARPCRLRVFGRCIIRF